MSGNVGDLKILRLWNIGRIAIIAVALSFINVALLIQFGERWREFNFVQMGIARSIERAPHHPGAAMTHPQRCETCHRIYLAGSWKNQPEILLIRDILKSQDHEVDCFASEDNGRISFNWSKLDDIQDKLPLMDAKDMLEVKRVREAFKEDKKWLDWCDLCILILPSGKSAHLEAGYAKGQGKTVVIFGELQKGDFDVMYGFADGIYRCDEIDKMIDFVNGCASHSPAQSERNTLLDGLIEDIKIEIKNNEEFERESYAEMLRNGDRRYVLKKYEQLRSTKGGK